MLGISALPPGQPCPEDWGVGWASEIHRQKPIAAPLSESVESLGGKGAHGHEQRFLQDHGERPLPRKARSPLMLVCSHQGVVVEDGTSSPLGQGAKLPVPLRRHLSPPPRSGRISWDPQGWYPIQGSVLVSDRLWTDRTCSRALARLAVGRGQHSLQRPCPPAHPMASLAGWTAGLVQAESGLVKRRQKAGWLEKCPGFKILILKSNLKQINMHVNQTQKPTREGRRLRCGPGSRCLAVVNQLSAGSAG